MGLYYATLCTTFITSLLSRMAEEKRYRMLSIFWITLTMIILIVFSGTRTGIGDTSMYKHSFNLLVQNPVLNFEQKDIGFSILSLIIIEFTTDPQALIFVVALITNFCNLYVFNKYRCAIELQVYIYITSGYFTVTMNGMRQCLAAALLFVGTPFIIKGNFKKYIVWVLICATFHESALFMIPIYFVVRIKPWTKEFYIMIIAACIGVLFYDVISPYIFKALGSTSYGEYEGANEGGSSFMRLVVNMVPIILAYFKRAELEEKWLESNIFINMSLVNAIFVGLGMANWIFNRFTLYLQLYNFVLLPYVIKNCLQGKERRLFYLGFLGCYLFFFYYEQVIGMNLQYNSMLIGR